MSERIRAHVGIIVGCLQPLSREERRAVLEEAQKKLLDPPCPTCWSFGVGWCDGGEKSNGTCTCTCHSKIEAAP